MPREGFGRLYDGQAIDADKVDEIAARIASILNGGLSWSSFNVGTQGATTYALPLSSFLHKGSLFPYVVRLPTGYALSGGTGNWFAPITHADASLHAWTVARQTTGIYTTLQFWFGGAAANVSEQFQTDAAKAWTIYYARGARVPKATEKIVGGAATDTWLVATFWCAMDHS